MLTFKVSLGKWTTHRVHKGNRVKWGGLCNPQPHQPGLIFPPWWNVRQKSAIVPELCGATYVRYRMYRVLLTVLNSVSCGGRTQKVLRQLYLFQPWQPPYSSSPWICPWWLAHRSCPEAPPSLPPPPAKKSFSSTLTDQIIIKGLVAICNSFYIYFSHTIHYRTKQDNIKFTIYCRMRLYQADVYEWNQWFSRLTSKSCGQTDPLAWNRWS